MNDAPSLHGLAGENELGRAPCPLCGGRSVVADTRPWHGGVKRRRKCRACRYRWTTIEVPYELVARLPRLAERLPAIAIELLELSKRSAEMARGLAAIVLEPEDER